MKAQPNVARLNELMDRDGLDALVVARVELHLPHWDRLSGHSGPASGLLTARSCPVLIGRNGKPEIVLSHFRSGIPISSATWLSLSTRVSGATYCKVAERLFAGGFQRIGIEFNHCPKRDFEIFSTAIPSAHFVIVGSCSTRCVGLRLRRSRALERSCRSSDDVYLEVLPMIKPGETERAVHARMMRGCVERALVGSMAS